MGHQAPWWRAWQRVPRQGERHIPHSAAGGGDHGGAGGVTPEPTLILPMKGYPAMSAGDVNGDGFGDAVVGRAVYFGGPTGLTAPQTLAQPGFMLGAVNGDG